jgi:signal transduction histidine kinase
VFISAFAVILFAGFFAAFLGMRSALRDRLVERAEFEAERALARVTAEQTGAPLVSECSVGLSVAGTAPLRAEAVPASGLDEATWTRIVGALVRRSTPRPHVERLERDGAPLVVALRDRGDGSVAWATVAVAVPPELRIWKLIAGGLAAAFSILVIASIEAVVIVQRAGASLGAAASALASDLKAPVPPTGVRELEAVADGLRTMAEGLHRAQAEREELHAALARRERLAALGRVVAGVAHEVRNPLAAIKLLADLVREGGPETERTRDLETLGREVDRLDRLVSDLLVFTRTAPRAPVMHDIAALAAERASLLVPWAGLRQISLRTSGSGSARIDVDGTTRALDNLLRNAIEASPTDGLVEVQVITRNQVIEVCVRDNGAGIPEARAAELFEPFFTTKPRGTGLGLALARAVARAHGGDLTFERALGRTQFTMRIADAR